MPLLRIGWLYPDLMNIYGDRGNIICLTRRCEWRGIAVEVRRIAMGGGLDSDACERFFIGGGQDREQRLVADDFRADKADALRQAVERGVPVLAVCGGYQLLGHEYLDADGSALEGLGLIDVHTEPARPGETRIIGNVVAEATFEEARGMPRLVGFENHGGRTILGPHAAPLARVVRGAVTTDATGSRATPSAVSSARTCTAHSFRRTPGSPTCSWSGGSGARSRVSRCRSSTTRWNSPRGTRRRSAL